MIRAGATLICSECGRDLYRITRDLDTDGEMLTASKVEPLAGQGAPYTGQVIECPEHGVVSCYLLPPAGAFIHPRRNNAATHA